MPTRSRSRRIILDLDHFKRVSDEYGHQAGDRLPIEVGRLFNRELRDSDILARYGGEEFLVISPNADRKEAIAIAERLRLAVETHRFSPRPDGTGEQEIRITVSIGLASFGDHAADEDSLVSLADANLYPAKRDGRNRFDAGEAGVERLEDCQRA